MVWYSTIWIVSAKIPKESSQRYDLNINIDVLVRGIPKGYVDKKGYRQNYIQVNEINDIKIDKIIEEKYYIDEDDNEYWNGKLIPETEPWNMNDPEQKELSDWLKSFN